MRHGFAILACVAKDQPEMTQAAKGKGSVQTQGHEAWFSDLRTPQVREFHGQILHWTGAWRKRKLQCVAEPGQASMFSAVVMLSIHHFAP